MRLCQKQCVFIIGKQQPFEHGLVMYPGFWEWLDVVTNDNPAFWRRLAPLDGMYQRFLINTEWVGKRSIGAIVPRKSTGAGKWSVEQESQHNPDHLVIPQFATLSLRADSLTGSASPTSCDPVRHEDLR